MNNFVEMSSADIDKTDVQSVLEVMRSGRLALGPKIPAFEEAIAQYVGVKYAVAVSSGTSALHLLVKALGIGPGDEVLVPSFTFAASVNAILFEGATPVFVDIETETYNLDPEDLVRKITPRTRAIMAVDVFGHPCAWSEIQTIAEKYHLHVIDDSCEALGAEYQGRKIGQFGNAATFAFYPNKQITTGEGGMIVTDDLAIAQQARSLRNQGRGAMGAWLEHEQIGYNYRMDEMSAALGVSQMKRLESFLEKRENVAGIYSRLLAPFDWVRIPHVLPEVRMSWFVYVITLKKGVYRDTVIEALQKQGVPSRGYFSPIHLQPYIRKQFKTAPGDLPLTEDIAQRTLALPFHNNMTEEQIDYVVTALKDAAAHI